MNDRIQRALDGDLSRDDLTAAESAEFDESNSLFDAVLRSIPAQPLPNLGVAVLRRMDAADEFGIPQLKARKAAQRRSHLFSWLWSPARVSISLRPAYAIGIAAVLALIVGARRGGDNDRLALQPDVAPVIESPDVLVHFSFVAPQARAVSLAGDFSNWAPTYTMKRAEPGVWTVVVPLKPGVHEYSFIVDGDKWVPDPAAPATADGFGGMNSRIAVLAPDARRSL